jgi:hypothetical protein
MKITLIIIICLISGCSGSWHGYSQEFEYRYILKHQSGNPAKDVTVLCVGNEGMDSISQILAQKMNADKPASNENGLLVLTQRATEKYGSYNYIGPFTFNEYSTSTDITCKLIYKGKTVHVLELTWKKEPQVIILKI